MQEQENKRLEREKQREMEEDRVLNLNKAGTGTWAPEAMVSRGMAPGMASTPSPTGYPATPTGHEGAAPHVAPHVAPLAGGFQD
jgi:hypothetical protein